MEEIQRNIREFKGGVFGFMNLPYKEESTEESFFLIANSEFGIVLSWELDFFSRHITYKEERNFDGEQKLIKGKGLSIFEAFRNREIEEVTNNVSSNI